MGKKLISLLVTAIIALSAIGCGQEQTPDDKTPQGSSNKLTVWCWDPAFNLYAMEEAEKVYKKDNPDFELEIVETPWEDIQTKLTTAASSGDLSTLPDIMLLQDNAFQKNVISYPDAFVELTQSGIDYSKFGAAKTAYSVVNNKNYGVPFDNGAVIGCYRTDVLAEAGYKIEDLTDITWNRFIEIGKDVLAKTGKPLLSNQSGESDLIMIMLQSAGASLFDAEGNPIIEDNDELKAVIEIYTELIKSGILIQVNDWDQYIGTLTNGTVAATINGCWIMASIQTATDQAEKWAITNMPSLEGIQGATNYSNNGGSSWAITKNSKNPELAMDFLAKTFAGSVEFYETILPKSGALATYLPAAESNVYEQPQQFFGGEAVYAKITDFAGKIPRNNTGVYYYEAREAVANAVTNILAGADMASELKSAQDTVNFTMGR